MINLTYNNNVKFDKKYDVAGVYCIKNIVNNLMYIGSSIRLVKRWKDHVFNLNSGKHDNSYLQNAWNKYGADKFIFEVLEKCSEEDVLLLEQKWIDKVQACNRKNGYNICPIAGNTRGLKMSKKTRKRMSESHRGKEFSFEHRKKISENNGSRNRDAWNKNKQLSDECKNKISIALKRRGGKCVLNFEKAEKIRSLYKSGKYTQRKLSDIYRVHIATITSILSGRIWTGFKKLHGPTKIKLNYEKAKEIRNKYFIEKKTYKMLSQEYSVSMLTIADVIKNKTWRND